MELTYATPKNLTFLGKSIHIACASGFNAKYGGLEMVIYLKEALSVLQKYPVDMLVFETIPKGEGFEMLIRLSGYHFKTGVLYEQKIAKRFDSLYTEKFWFKIDDHGSHYVGTFLFPEEY